MGYTAHIIVFGNHAGGNGKSTAAMHVAVALLRLGYKVGTIDLDSARGKLTQYMANRATFRPGAAMEIPAPMHRGLIIGENEAEFITRAVEELRGCDFIIIDTPGGIENDASLMAHGHADTLITPVSNLQSLGTLGRIEGTKVTAPSPYTMMVEGQNIARLERWLNPMHWLVLHTRLPKNPSPKPGQLLFEMSGMFGFSIVPGLHEDPLIPKLYEKGMTLLDLKEEGALSLPQIAARQEVRRLIRAIGPEKIKGHRKPL